MKRILNKQVDSREAEGRQTTSIRPKSLRRAQIVVPHLDEENITDFISISVDERVRRVAKQRNIQLPAELAFIAPNS